MDINKTKNINNYLAVEIGTNTIKSAVITSDGQRFYLGAEKCENPNFVAMDKNDVDVNTIVKGVLKTVVKAQSQYNVGFDDIKIVATAGLRNAPAEQANDVVERVQQEIYQRYMQVIDVEVVDGRREAELAIKGIFSNAGSGEKNAIVIDSGGASTEVSYVKCKEGKIPQILKTISIGVGNKKFDKDTYKEKIERGIEELEIEGENDVEVIMCGDAVHFMKNRGENLLETDGKKKAFYHVKKTLEYFSSFPNGIGYKRALILTEVFKNLKSVNETTVKAVLRGVKDGCLHELVENNIAKEKQGILELKPIKRVPFKRKLNSSLIRNLNSRSK